MPRHTKHDLSDLEDALEHVVNEFWKYRQSVVDYSKIWRVGGDAAIEFRVLHHRVLLEFFYGYPRHEDNIFAWEYIDDWKSSHDCADLPWLDGYMTRCHTMLAHVSKTRTEMKKAGLRDWAKDWQVVEPHLDQTISQFLSGLSPERRRICLGWVNDWSRGTHPSTKTLRDLAIALGPA
jgi:hypothetical protein